MQETDWSKSTKSIIVIVLFCQVSMNSLPPRPPPPCLTKSPEKWTIVGAMSSSECFVCERYWLIWKATQLCLLWWAGGFERRGFWSCIWGSCTPILWVKVRFPCLYGHLYTNSLIDPYFLCLPVIMRARAHAHTHKNICIYIHFFGICFWFIVSFFWCFVLLVTLFPSATWLLLIKRLLVFFICAVGKV